MTYLRSMVDINRFFLMKLLSFSDLNFPHEGSQVQIMHRTDASKPTTCWFSFEQLGCISWYSLSPVLMASPAISESGLTVNPAMWWLEVLFFLMEMFWWVIGISTSKFSLRFWGVLLTFTSTPKCCAYDLRRCMAFPKMNVKWPSPWRWSGDVDALGWD